MSLDPLWQPLTIGSVTIKNRVVLTAHGLGDANPTSMIGQHGLDYYEERARGGVGLIITEAQNIHRSGRGMGLASLEGWRPEVVPVYRKLAEVVHRHGAKVFAELGHIGPPDDNTVFLDSFRAILSPSGIPAFNTNEMPKPMEEEDFAMLLDGFVQTARNAKEGALDGVEIHSAHGFLLHTFLSPLTNRRTDQYGGSTENRCRFMIEAARAIRAEVGEGFPIGVRFSFSEFLPGGIDEEEGAAITRVLHEADVFDYFSITGGVLMTLHNQISPMGVEGGLFDPFAAKAKSIVGPDIPVITVNKITAVDQAAAVVAGGTADMVGMVRAHLADPELVNKAQAGDVAGIRECVNANQGCLSRLGKGRVITCTVNPAAGREAEWGHGTLKQASSPRKVVVIGAGPAGLKVAEVAAQRGHEVVVFDREAEIGGNVRYAARLPRRNRWSLVMKRFDHGLRITGVTLRLGVEATADSILAERPDAVVVATGSTFDKDGFSSALAFRPGIPGLDTTTVLTPPEAIDDVDRCGERVVIVDDSEEYTGLGLAELLADAGKQVEVVSRHLMVGANLVTTADLGHLYPRVIGLGATITAQHYIADIGGGEATVASVWGGSEHRTPLDSIVLNMGRSPVRTLFDDLRGRYDGELHRIGDCLAPRHVDEAFYEGEKVGRAL